MLFLLKYNYLIEKSDLEEFTAVFPELESVIKLNLKGEGGDGALQSNSERCHQHGGFTLALAVMTLTESIHFNTVYFTYKYLTEYLQQHWGLNWLYLLLLLL